MSYNFKDLGKRLKPHGLEFTEKGLCVMTEEVLNWVEESAKKSDNKFDDLVVPFIPLLKEKIQKEIDKIHE